MPEPPDARRRPAAAELGARIRAERESAGVSLRALAHRLGVSPSLLSQLERGLAQPGGTARTTRRPLIAARSTATC